MFPDKRVTEDRVRNGIVNAIASECGVVDVRLEGFVRVECGPGGPSFNLHFDNSKERDSAAMYLPPAGLKLPSAHRPASSKSHSVASSPLRTSSPDPSRSANLSPADSAEPSMMDFADLHIQQKTSRRKAYRPKRVPAEFSLPDPTKKPKLEPFVGAVPAAGLPGAQATSPGPYMAPLSAESLQSSVRQALGPLASVFPNSSMYQLPEYQAVASMASSHVSAAAPWPGYGLLGADVNGDHRHHPLGPLTLIGKPPGPGDLLTGSPASAQQQPVRSKMNGEAKRKIKPKPTAAHVNGLGGGGDGTGRVGGGPYSVKSSAKRNPNKDFPCNQCDQLFKSLNTLTEHTTAVHECFRCEKCNAKFTQRSNLMRHSLKHLGYKPFKCATCKKEYYRKDHLVRHIEVSHPGTDPKQTIINIMSSSKCHQMAEEESRMGEAAAAAANHHSGSAVSSPVPSSPVSSARPQDAAAPIPAEELLEHSHRLPLEAADWALEPSLNSMHTTPAASPPTGAGSEASNEQPEDLRVFLKNEPPCEPIPDPAEVISDGQEQPQAQEQQLEPPQPQEQQLEELQPQEQQLEQLQPQEQDQEPKQEQELLL